MKRTNNSMLMYIPTILILLSIILSITHPPNVSNTISIILLLSALVFVWLLRRDKGGLNASDFSLGELKKELEVKQGLLADEINKLKSEMEGEEKESQLVLETIDEGIVVTNKDGNIKYVNPAFIKMSGFTDAELIGRTIEEKIKVYDIQGNEFPPETGSDEAVKDLKNKHDKAKLQTKNNKLIAVVISASTIKIDGRAGGVVRVYRDITEELRLSQQKDEFFSIASHELRTPLSVLAGNLDTFLHYSKSHISEEDRKMIQDTLSATDRLIKMVNDFLNVSRLDQGRIKYDIVKLNLCDLVQKVVDELKPFADAKSIDLLNLCSRNHEGEVMADEILTREILTNLIDNSIKFTENGSVKIQHEVVGDLLRTSITDTGMGIDRDKQDMLFGRFQQAMEKTISRKVGGTGLGLYISREFARIMDGDLVLDKSEPGKGTVFSFSLPLASSKFREEKK